MYMHTFHHNVYFHIYIKFSIFGLIVHFIFQLISLAAEVFGQQITKADTLHRTNVLPFVSI